MMITTTTTIDIIIIIIFLYNHSVTLCYFLYVATLLYCTADQSYFNLINVFNIKANPCPLINILPALNVENYLCPSRSHSFVHFSYFLVRRDRQ